MFTVSGRFVSTSLAEPEGVSSISRERHLVPVRRYVRVVVLPCPEATRCLFRTRSSQAHDALELNEVFAMQLSPSAFRQKTLRVDVCSTTESRREECLVGVLKTTGYLAEKRMQDC